MTMSVFELPITIMDGWFIASIVASNEYKQKMDITVPEEEVSRGGRGGIHFTQRESGCKEYGFSQLVACSLPVGLAA